MDYSKMKKAQLIEEIEALQEKVAELERAQAERKRAGQAILERRIWLLVAGMFVLLCISVWLTEIVDLPRLLLGAPQTPVNWREAIIETVLIASVGLYVVSRLIHDITERKRAEEELRRERDFAESLVRTAQTIVLVLDTEGRIVRFNPYMEEISGYRLEEVQGKDWFTTFLPQPDQDWVRELFLKAVSDIQTRGNVNPIVTKDGREREIEWYDKTLKDADGNAVGLLAIGQDITERKRAEEQIQASLREKEVLLREIHHRVKNNLQVISSLLDMRSMRADDRQAIDFFTDARAKVHTMALIHSQLYQSERFDQIDMGSHVRELVNYLSQVYATKSRLITPVIEPSDVYLAITQAIPCALILNEVISNAFKHAFEEGQKGTIEVSMQRSADDMILLRVKDDGVGLPEGIDIDKADSLGLKLIRNLVQEQLNVAVAHARDKSPRSVLFRHFPERSQPFGGLNNWRGTDER